MNGPSSIISTETKQIAKAYVNNWSQYISLVEDQNRNDLLKLIDLLDDVRRKWKTAEEERDFYKSKCEELEAAILAQKLPTTDKEKNNLDMESKMDEDSEPSDPPTPVEDDVRSFMRRRSISVPILSKSRENALCEEETFSRAKKISPPPAEAEPPPNFVNTNIRKIENRAHDFEGKRCFTKVMCCVCSSKVEFGNVVAKCQNCKTIYHQHCRARAPIPCIPWCPPPKSINGRLRLTEYCSDYVIPKIPHLIIQCIQYLNTEKRKKGLYIYNYSTVEAELLLNLILNESNPPPFRSYGPHTVAYCVLLFLTNLRESLILESSLSELLKASQQPDDFDLDTVVADLPIVHKNTLAYLFIHWKCLNYYSNYNGLTGEVLGRAIVPVIMRVSSKELPTYMPIFIRLLAFPPSYWEKVIDDGAKFFDKAPCSRRSSKSSRKAEISNAITVAKIQQAATIRRNKF